MRIKAIFFLGILGAAIGVLAIISRSFVGPLTQLPQIVTSSVLPTPSAGQSDQREPVEYQVQEVARGLAVPWAIAFTSPTRMLVTERAGTVRVIESGKLQDAPLHTVENVSTRSEEGLMGMVLDPDYASNRHIYLCYAYEANGTLFDRVIRLTDNGSSLGTEQTIIDMIPAARFHAGCELGFGPDGKLYISTGDATDRQIAQRNDSLGGKLLRLNADGSIPEDNPFPGSAIYTLGHRNPQGLDWTSNGKLWSAEHGPSGNDGPGGGDEINRIIAGENYGWPLVSHTQTRAGLQSPQQVFTPAIAPGSLLAYDGALFSPWRDNLFVAMLRGEGIMRFVLNATQEKIERSERLEQISFGRIREVTQGPDGAIYFATSNQDGRGRARDGDDKIYKIIPHE